MAVEKRVRFRSWWLPWLLVAPQMAVVIVFFFWPAGQALYNSVLQQDAFGTSQQFVGMENFSRLWNDDTYLASFQTTAVFSILVAGLGLLISMTLAVMADRVVRLFLDKDPERRPTASEAIEKLQDLVDAAAAG